MASGNEPLIALAIIAVVGAIVLLAKAGIIITFLPTSQIAAIVAGESLERIILSSPDFVYAPNEDTIYSVTEARAKEAAEANNGGVVSRFNWPTWYERLGIFVVGIPLYHRVLSYPFSWPKMDQPKKKMGEALDGEEDGGNTEQLQIIQRSEPVSTLMLRYAYPIKVGGIELQGNITVSIVALVTLFTKHPRRTLFGIPPTGNWINKALAATRGRIRDFGAQQDFDDLRKQQHGKPGSRFEKALKLINSELLAEAGVEIESVDFQALAIDDPEIEKAFQAQALAREKGAAGLIAAGKEAEARERLAAARQKELEAEAAGLEQLVAGRSKEELDALAKISVSENQKEWPVQTFMTNGGTVPQVVVPTNKQTTE